jgi:hypothetical protein
MRLARLLEWLVQRSRTLSLVLLVIMAGLVLADIVTEPAYVRFPWDRLGGFAAVYGFIACIVIIALAKGLGQAFLYLPEDYYNEACADQDEEDEDKHD